MNKKYYITSIICTFSRSEYIYETIKSIKNQTYQVDEVLIVESGDYEYYEEYTNNFNNFNDFRVRVLYFPGALLGAARNFGVKNSKEGIIIFGDDDDIWRAHRVSRIINCLNSKKVSICVHNFDVFGGAPEKTNQLKKISYGREYLIQNLISNKVGGGSSFAAKKEILSLIPFDEKLKRAEDIDWWIRLMLAEINIAVLNESLVSYRLHSRRMSGLDLNGIRGELLFINKYMRLSIVIMIGAVLKTLRILVKYSIK